MKDFCEWAATHPRGDGDTIRNLPGGILSGVRVSGAGGGSVVEEEEKYLGAFRITIVPDGDGNSIIRVIRGYALEAKSCGSIVFGTHEIFVPVFSVPATPTDPGEVLQVSVGLSYDPASREYSLETRIGAYMERTERKAVWVIGQCFMRDGAWIVEQHFHGACLEVTDRWVS